MTIAATTIVAVASDLCVERGKRRVLNGVALDLEAGTVTLLAGPNGAGKTTLIRVLSGSLSPVAGRVSILGRDPSRDRRARTHLGLVPQEIALYPRLTVRENIEVFAAFSGASATPALVSRCLDRTGLGAVEGALVSTLSGGFQRRANIACALVGQPKLLLLDEPLVGLDPLARRAICADLQGLARRDGVALLLATHDLDDGGAIADSVVVLQAGRVVARGSPDALVAAQFSAGTSRIEVVLMDEPDRTARTALAARGFGPTHEPRLWQSLHRPAEWELSEPADLGLPVSQIREWRHRRLRLADAYESLVGAGEAA